MTDSPMHAEHAAGSPHWGGTECDAYATYTSDVGPDSEHHQCPDFNGDDPMSKGEDVGLGVPTEDHGHAIPMEENFSKSESEFEYPPEDCCDDQDQQDDAEVNSTVSDDPDHQYGSDYQGNNTSMSEGEDDSIASHDCRMSSNSSQPSFSRPSHVVGMEVSEPHLVDSNRTSCCSFSEAKMEDENAPSSSSSATLEPHLTGAVYTTFSKPLSDLTGSSPLPVENSSMRAPTQASSDEAVDFRAAFKSNELSNPDCSKNFISTGSLTSSLLTAVNSQESDESNQNLMSALFVRSATLPSVASSSRVDVEDSHALVNNLLTKDLGKDHLLESEMVNSANDSIKDQASLTGSGASIFESISKGPEDSIAIASPRVRKLRSRSMFFNNNGASSRKQPKSKIKRRSTRNRNVRESLSTECNSLPGELKLGRDKSLEPENSTSRPVSPSANSMPAILMGSDSNENENSSLCITIDAATKDSCTPSENVHFHEKEFGSLQSVEETTPVYEVSNYECSISEENNTSKGGHYSNNATCSETTAGTDHISVEKQSSPLNVNIEIPTGTELDNTHSTVTKKSKHDCKNVAGDSASFQLEKNAVLGDEETRSSNNDDLPDIENETNTSQNDSQRRGVTSNGISKESFDPVVLPTKSQEKEDSVHKEDFKLKNRKRSSVLLFDDDNVLPDIDIDVRPRRANKGFKKMFEISSENIEELPDIEEDVHSSRVDQPKRKRMEECNETAGVEVSSEQDLGVLSEVPKRAAVTQDTNVSLTTQSRTVSSTVKNPVSVAGSSRDTAEELSARYYQSFLRYKKRIADYDRRLREQFTDSDSDDSTDQAKKEADRRHWIEKKNILKDKMNQLIELNGGPFNMPLPRESDTCVLPSLYPSSGDHVAPHEDVRSQEASNHGDNDDDIIVDDDGGSQARQKQSLGGWRRRPKLWLRKRKSEDADIVDLTNDVESDADDGDVEVLQHDKPVVYLKTESRRKRRRTARGGESSCSGTPVAAQTIDLDNNDPPPPPQPIDFSDPNLLFGTLLEQPDRFILPKPAEEKQDPDVTPDVKDANGPNLLAAMGPLGLNRCSGSGGDGGAMWSAAERPTAFTDSKTSTAFTDSKTSVQTIGGPSTSNSNPGFSRGSPSGSSSCQYTDKAAAMEKIWQMLDVPDDDLVQCRSRQQASESAIPPALESAHFAAYGRPATPPSPYRTAPPPGCCPDYDSLHDTAARQSSSEPKSRSLPPAAPADQSGANEEEASSSSSGFARGLGCKEMYRPAARPRTMPDFELGAHPQRINIGNSVRNILSQNRFGATDDVSSNPFSFASRPASSFLPIDRPGSSGRLASASVSTSSSQGILTSHILNPVPCMRSAVRRPQHPTFQSSSASDLSATPVFGSDSDGPIAPPSCMRRAPIGLDIPPAHSCSRVTRASSLGPDALPFPYIRTHNFVGFQPSTSYSDAITAVASIPLPPSVPTQTSNSNLYPFIGTSRNDVPLNLEQRNSGPGRAGTSRVLGAIPNVESGSGSSGPILAAATSSGTSAGSGVRIGRGNSALLPADRNSDVHFVGANVTVMVEDDDDDDAEAEEIGGDTDSSSPSSQDQNMLENKPSSSTSSAANTSSSGRDDIEISCPICFDSLADIKERRGHLVSTVCGHLFCEGCLDAAVRRHKQCPKCRKKLTKRQFHKLYL